MIEFENNRNSAHYTESQLHFSWIPAAILAAILLSVTLRCAFIRAESNIFITICIHIISLVDNITLWRWPFLYGQWVAFSHGLFNYNYNESHSKCSTQNHIQTEMCRIEMCNYMCSVHKSAKFRSIILSNLVVTYTFGACRKSSVWRKWI